MGNNILDIGFECWILNIENGGERQNSRKPPVHKGF